MSGFSTDWLALRAPYDANARDKALLERLRDWRVRMGGIGILDLGCGTGASLRALAPLLGGRQRWIMADHDPALLKAIPDHTARWAAAAGHVMADDTVTGKGFAANAVPHRADLAASLDDLPLDGVRLLTASALIDLVSADWLARLVDFCRLHSLACYAALSYDGRLDWTPVDRLDAEMHTLFDRHQRGTKSFGPALGPDAAPAAVAAFRAAGFTVETGRSDWQLEAEDRDMQEALLAGYVQATLEIAPDRAGEIEHWRQRRRFAIGAGTSRHRVGHTDLLALPPT
ncbi:MAG: class I SAM-dependent methyltransferase [Oceanibaculum nanhaiense]|jgi:SAM-dependent methyltransferase|uniref:class I SAM-dependent methyltransferase n=1 Tax=Oceanibaculum nanhaiense TaxID=1909734 RepID=UPI0032F036EB